MTRRHRPRTLVPTVAALVLLAGAACSDSSDDGTGSGGEATTDDASSTGGGPSAGDAAPVESEGEPAPDPTAATDGTVTVDGVSYVATELRSCEPVQVEMVDRELELQAMVGNDDGDTGTVHVYVQTLNGLRFDEVSWSGPEGVFGADAEPQPDFTLEGGRVGGSHTLVDAMEGTDSVTVEFDLPVPSELIDCSI